ncbi:hypothetical protein, partial [Paenibacillus phytohabitans]|uniref:hypothetical protein n=1 Tax=Paenibacillus phytohabitans TaxID=2654978 RepID=UPI00300AD285
ANSNTNSDTNNSADSCTDSGTNNSADRFTDNSTYSGTNSNQHERLCPKLRISDINRSDSDWDYSD